MDYKTLKEEYNKVGAPQTVVMDIVDFCDLLNNPADFKLEAIDKRDLLRTGYYAVIEVDGNKVDVYVEKYGTLRFEQNKRAPIEQ